MDYVQDFKERSSTYLLACSTYMLNEKNIDNAFKCVDYIEQDSFNNGLTSTTIRMYVEEGAPEIQLQKLKGYIADKISGVTIVSILKVPSDQIVEIIDFANDYNSYIVVDTDQTHEQAKREYEKGTDFSGEDH